jgi:hypothetical protein
MLIGKFMARRWDWVNLGNLVGGIQKRGNSVSLEEVIM